MSTAWAVYLVVKVALALGFVVYLVVEAAARRR